MGQEKGVGKRRSGRKVRRPTIEELEEWLSEGVAEATDGCPVELDGTCEHGCPSWLIELGLI